MSAVMCGAERYPVDPVCLQYAPDSGLWFYQCVGGDFVVRGGPEGPDPVRFDQARRVAANINAFVASADAYLATFVAPERFKASGPWEFQGAEFGVDPTVRADIFEVVLFLGDDIYGMWAVRFGLSGAPMDSSIPHQFDRFYPHQFRRRQV